MERLYYYFYGEILISEDIVGVWEWGDICVVCIIDVYVDVIVLLLVLVVNVIGCMIMLVGGGLLNVMVLLVEIDCVLC